MLRLGIIGCGRVTTMFHLKAIDAVKEVCITALADTSKSQLDEVQRKSKAKSVYLDYLELLEDSQVDAVAVNTPPKFHEEMVLQSLKHGKHVLCEKPLALTVEGCKRIKELQEETGLVVLPGHNYAFTPSLTKMEELIQDNTVGELESLSVYFENYLKSYGSRTDFRIHKENGLVEDVLPHILSVSNILAGRAQSVDEVSWWCSSYDVCDNMVAKLQTSQGAVLNCRLSWTRLIPRFKIEYNGTKGKISTDLMINPYSVTVETEYGKEKHVDRGLDWYLDLVKLKHPSFINQYRYFEQLTKGEHTPRITIEDEISIIKMIEKVSEWLKEPPVSR